MKLLVMNGPNINMLGIREPQHYGKETYADLVQKIQTYCDQKAIPVEFFQSNHEGDLVDRIQQAYFDGVDGIVINPAAYTHTSVAILDALKAVALPTVEVHLTDISTREEFRRFSFVSLYAQKTICGKGFDGYKEGLEYIKSLQ